MAIRTIKLMTMHKALHLRDVVDRLDMSGKEGGRGLARMEDSFNKSIQRLEDNIEKHGGRLITATRNNTKDTRTSGTTRTKNKLSRNENNSMDVLSD